MNRPHLAAIWLAVTCLSIAPYACARTTWYTVEVIVYSLLKADANTESWPAEPGQPALDGSVELTARLGLSEERSSATPHAFTRLNAGNFTLKRAISRLRRSSLYRPIVHVAWHQPGFDRKEARAVHISGSAPAPRRGSASTGATNVDGTIKVWRERYLHVGADLVYGLGLNPAPSATASATIPGLSSGSSGDYAYFRLQERRRMRSRELHFLDHPMFGVLVKITPFTPPPPPEQQAPLNPASGNPASGNPASGNPASGQAVTGSAGSSSRNDTPGPAAKQATKVDARGGGIKTPPTPSRARDPAATGNPITPPQSQ